MGYRDSAIITKEYRYILKHSYAIEHVWATEPGILTSWRIDHGDGSYSGYGHFRSADTKTIIYGSIEGYRLMKEYHPGDTIKKDHPLCPILTCRFSRAEQNIMVKLCEDPMGRDEVELHRLWRNYPDDNETKTFHDWIDVYFRNSKVDTLLLPFYYHPANPLVYNGYVVGLPDWESYPAELKKKWLD